MSGGHFDYDQYRIDNIAEEIEKIISLNKVEKKKEDLNRWDYDTDGNVYEDCKYYYYFDNETIECFKEAVKVLRQAAIYAHRIDWLLSGDDGEGRFRKRLKEQLDELNDKIKTF